MKRFVICGSREWSDETTIRNYLETLRRYHGTVRISHGACRGADTLASRIADELGFEVVEYPADWSTGRGAGHARNARMLEQEKPHRVIAFALVNADGVPSPGTDDCIRRALLAGLPVTVVPGRRGT